MQFVLLNEKEFSKAALELSCSNFHQSAGWGKLKEKNGWIPHYLGIKKKKKIVAATLLLEKKVLKKYSMFYAPRGYLIDFHDFELLKFFTDEIKKFAKEKKGIFVKIDPYFIHRERDIDGKIVEGGIDNSSVVEYLKSLGYRHNGFTLRNEDMQPRWAFAIDLEGKTLDDVLAQMEAKTRRIIRKNERNNVEIREIGEEELHLFKNIMNHTSERRNFIDRPFEYYKNMLETLGDNAKIYIAELNIENMIQKTKEEIKENEEAIERKTKELEENSPKINREKTKLKIEELTELSANLDKRLTHYQKIMDEDGKRIILGGVIYMIYNKEILSLFGGQYDKYKEFWPIYTIHWELIKYALENGYTKYNFYGIIGEFENTEDELYGLYDFKKGFGGHVEEYIGEFDLVINKFMYILYKYGFKAYKKLKR